MLRLFYVPSQQASPPPPPLLCVPRRQRELQGKGVGKDAEWAAVLRRPLFAAASDGGSASLSHLLDLWVERQHLLWKVGRGGAAFPAICSTLDRPAL